MKTILARSEEFKRLSSFGATLAHSVQESRTLAAAATLARSEELKRLSSFRATLARSVQESRTLAAAATLARSEELKRLSSFRATLARSVQESRTLAAAATLARSEELKRLSSFRATLAHSVQESKTLAAAAALARSEEVKRLSSFGAALARSAETSEALDISASFADKHDEATTHTGLDPELITFPNATYDKVLLSARFRLSFDSVPVPQAIESTDPGAAFNPRHWQILSELEQRLRQVVEQQLEKLAGPNWIKKRIPQSVRERWTERQKQDCADGRPVYAPVQYADFMDLADVITRRDNWREAFQTIFRDQSDITASLRRLHPVRKALAHSRPLGRADVLTLVSETARIFRALGMRVLH